MNPYYPPGFDESELDLKNLEDEEDNQKDFTSPLEMADYVFNQIINLK